MIRIKTSIGLSARNRRGAGIAEFAPALVVLVGFVLIPLLDLTIVPVRWMLAHEIVDDYSRRLALCETFRQSGLMMEADPSLKTRLEKLGGLSVKSVLLRLKVSRAVRTPGAQDVLVVDHAGMVPAEWLPDGRKAPCSYAINLQVQALICPAIMLAKAENGVSIPGLNAPIPLTVTSSHEWANLGRDPRNGKYFLNE